MKIELSFNSQEFDTAREKRLELVNFRSLSALFLLTPALKHFKIHGTHAGCPILPPNLNWPCLQTIRADHEDHRSGLSGGLALGSRPLPNLRSAVLLNTRTADDLLLFLDHSRPHLKHLHFNACETDSAHNWAAVFNLVQGLETLELRLQNKLDPTTILQGLQQSSLAQSLSVLRCSFVGGPAFVPVTTWRSLLPPTLKHFTGYLDLHDFSTVKGYYAATSVVEGEDASESVKRIWHLILEEMKDWARTCSTTIQLTVSKAHPSSPDYQALWSGIPHRFTIVDGMLRTA